MSMQMDVDGQPSEPQEEIDDLENYTSEDEICGICRDIVIDRGVLDGCQHWFCYTCIDNWSAITNRCPLCKVEFQHITCTPVYDSTGAGIEDNHPLTSDDDDWYVQGESNTLSFPSFYIDAEVVVCLDGGDCTAWFDVDDTSVDGRDDIEGLDASAAHIGNLLSSEPSDVKLGIGGFSMGAAAALHSAACYAHGKFSSGIPYPITLSAVISLSGWLPCSRTLRGKMESSHMAARRAISLPILLCHGRADEVVSYKNGEQSTEFLQSSGFSYLTFKSYNGLGHYTIPEEMDDVCKWLSSRLGVDRSR